MAVRNVPLKDFLATAQVPSDSKMPWLHTTQAHRAVDIIAEKKILTVPCDVFHGEELCYLFVGRPAYKYQLDEGETPFFVLPAVFVVRFQTDPQLKRVYPFDSGAFLKKRLPSYIATFTREMYELEPDRASVGKIVGTFFGSDKAYMKRAPRGLEELKNEHSLLPRHAPVVAVSQLYQEKGSDRFDDRAAAIEIQLDSHIELTPENLLGVILPEEYKREKEYIRDIKAITRHVEFYGMHPLNIAAYFGQIYDAVDAIYRKTGIRL